MMPEVQTEFRTIADTFTEIKVSIAKLETDISWLKAGMFTVIGLLLPILGLLVALVVRK